jgi:ABC-type multidrug transport system fused ATPase/permease subunit
MAIDDIRVNTAIVLQKNVLFADTVANNIKFGTPFADRTAIEDAARVACADDFIAQMAEGYDAELGERGGKLSAGQRQRLSIARAIVRNTPILILDEPTASLDARTEQQVLANLSEWGIGKVIFLITHRLSTIRNADQIAFLENGRIKELGQHDELMARDGGRYRAFVNAEIFGNAAAEDLE